MDRRKEIADRVIARWKERGFALDADPHYLRLVELWIAGEIGGTEMRQRYAQLLRDRANGRAGLVEPVQQPSLVELKLAAGPSRSDESSQQMHVDPPAGADLQLEPD